MCAARSILSKYGLEPSVDEGGSDDVDAALCCRVEGLIPDSNNNGTVAPVAGVDVRLRCADGAHFNAPPRQAVEAGHIEQQRARSSATETDVASWLSNSALTEHSPSLCLIPPPVQLFSRVLVDAECTHDGSIKHVAKFAAQSTAGGNSNSFSGWGWDSFERRVLDPERIATVTGLQRALLWNGFRLLAPIAKESGDGRAQTSLHCSAALVYSTCSLSRNQNEDVVAWLLQHCPSARVAPIDVMSASSKPTVAQPTLSKDTDSTAAAAAASIEATDNGAENLHSWPCRESPFMRNTLRFDPVTSGTSGLFVAKIIKLR